MPLKERNKELLVFLISFCMVTLIPVISLIMTICIICKLGGCR